MDSQLRILRFTIGAVLATMAVALVAGTSTEASHPASDSHTYTLNADFDAGTQLNVDHDIPDQLQLDETTETLPFIWVAASQRGTIVKIDTATGTILGEYWSAPQNMQKNPSRTTVDANGNVWSGNRNESSGGQGSVIHVGLEENGQCVDRNSNGTIETSNGLGDIRPWPNAGGEDTAGGVTTAEDECIIHFVRTAGIAIRHVSIDGSNNVWVGGGAFGAGIRKYELLSPTGASLRVIDMANSAQTGEPVISSCCYGGLVDGGGILWGATLANYLIRIDPSKPDGDADLVNIIPTGLAYGMASDSAGNIWISNFGTTAQKISPAGAVLGTFGLGGSGGRGVAVTADDDVWVANSSSASVTRIDNAGAIKAVIPVGSTPTGVSVDAAGKVWATNLGSSTVSRIDPTTDTVDLTVNLGAGAGPYNYSDMTGSTVLAPPSSGTWTIVHDSGTDGAEWGLVSWNADTPSDSSLAVTAASSTDATCTAFNPAQPVSNNVDLTVADGQCLRVTVSFTRATTGESPVLFDLTIEAFLNDPPTAIAGGPYEVDEGSSVTLDASGSTDPDGDPLTYAWDLDNDGSYETPGVTAAFLGVDGPSVHTVGLEVCDDSNVCDTTTVDVTVHNVVPTANAGADQSVLRNEVVSLSGSWTDPAEAADDLYSWAWDLDGDAVDDSSGTASYGDTVPESTSFATAGTYVLTFTVTDKDGGTDSDTVVIEVVNQPPSCDAAAPSIELIWPPNHQFVPVNILGLTDDDGDAVSVTITSIFQDEPVLGPGSGNFAPDGQGVGTDTAEVRAERTGTKKDGGNGRVYHIGFTADDGLGGECSGVVTVGVPHDQGQNSTPVDDGPLYDSTTS